MKTSASRDLQALAGRIEEQAMTKITPAKTSLITVWTALAFVFAGLAAQAGTPAAVSPWTDGFNNKARLVAGRASAAAGGPIYAGLEIAMPAGWKTYWRSPGEAGGIPPEFDWSGSENLATVRVLYPVPHRLVDKGGATIGYKDHILFPVVVEAKDISKPVTLTLKAAYGVCKELCVPAEAELTLAIAPDVGPSAEIEDALKTVPGVPVAGRDPALTAWRIETADGKPKLILDVTDPGGDVGDAFADVPDGTYLPLPKMVSASSGRLIYEVDLTDGVDLKALKGKSITVTLAGSKGQSEIVIKIGEQ